MNMMNCKALALAIGLAFSLSAIAQTPLIDQASGEGRAVEHNAAKAEPRAKFKPSEDVLYKLRVDSADADYAMARKNCADMVGNLKYVCVKEAKAAATAAKAEAKVRFSKS